MKRLIVNADDFGLTEGVNRAIIECHTGGIVSSATLMANMPAFEDAVRRAKAHPMLGVGLHFNITQGPPLADPARIPGLLDANGNFPGTGTELAKRLLRGRFREDEVIRELRAQIERALDAGLGLTHVDTHKHAHALPSICRAIARTIGDYGIRAMRLPRERGAFGWRGTSWNARKQAAAAAALSWLCIPGARALRECGIQSTDHFFGITQTGFWTREWLLALPDHLPEGVSELMCHPGYDDADLGAIGTRLRISRVNEMNLLTDPAARARLTARDVRLITYAQL
jgi:hopanoid biosynthesis associated protein HpnK